MFKLGAAVTSRVNSIFIILMSIHVLKFKSKRIQPIMLNDESVKVDVYRDPVEDPSGSVNSGNISVSFVMSSI